MNPKNRRPPTLCTLMVAVASLLGEPSAGRAHHILGLPHYKYSDNYPQTPFLEIEATAGGYEVKFVTFPGIPRPGKLTRVQVRVRDPATGDAFLGPMTFSIQQRRWPFGPKVLQPKTPMTVTELQQLDPEARFGSAEAEAGKGRKTRQYSARVRFPEEGPFQVVVGFRSRDGDERIPFPVRVGNPGPDLVLLGLAGLTVGGTTLIVAVLRRRQRLIKAGEAPGSLAEGVLR